MPSDLDLIKQIYSILEGNVFFGDRLQNRQMATLLSPGQFISNKLDLSQGADAYTVWELTNKALAASFLYKPLLTTISGMYEQILLGAALPKVQLTPDQQKQLARVKADIKRWDRSYSRGEKAYNDADYALSAAIERHAPDRDIVRFTQDRGIALRNWVNNNHKNDYESARGVENDLTSLDPTREWAARRNEFDQSAAQSAQGNYYRTGLIPPPLEWDKSGWATQTFTIKDTYQYDYSKTTHLDAGASGGWGLWSVGGSYSKDETWQRSSSSSSDLNIKFDYLVVEISRPWLRTDLLDARYWRWKKGAANILLSDGGNVTANPPEAPRGALPMLPTHWFLTRNVEISGAWSQADMNFHSSQITAGANVGWGPWSAHGSYSESTSEKTATSHFSGTTLLIPQPQILAVFGTLLNRMPRPTEALNWGPDAEKSPPSYDLYAQEEAEAREVRSQQYNESFALREAIAHAVDQVRTEFAINSRSSFDAESVDSA